jgi:hypothetical protein
MNQDHRFFIPFWCLFEIKLHMGEAMSIKDEIPSFGNKRLIENKRIREY